MKEYDDFFFYQQFGRLYYEWVEENDPSMFEEIRSRVKEGRWVIVGGWWTEPDCNAPCGESFVRQGLYGQRYFEEKFGGDRTYSAIMWTASGITGSFPKILKKCRAWTTMYSCVPAVTKWGLQGKTLSGSLPMVLR